MAGAVAEPALAGQKPLAGGDVMPAQAAGVQNLRTALEGSLRP